MNLSRAMMRRWISPKAFTLLELLVTIAIVAITLALLFPVMGGMRSRARTVQCMNNLRAYGTGLLAYLADYGTIPLPASNGQGPNFQTALTPNYIPKELFCPVTRIAPPDSTYPKNYKVTYTGNIGLAQSFPRLKGIPAPLSRIVLASEMMSGDGFQYGLHFNKAMWGGSARRGADLPAQATIPCAYHGPANHRGMNLFFADGSARLIQPDTGDWYDTPTYGDATNGGYFFDANQFAAMKSGALLVR